MVERGWLRLTEFRRRLVKRQIEQVREWLSDKDRLLKLSFRQVRAPGLFKSASNLPLPNFLVIGAQKSGTVWLNTNLRTHPDIFLPNYEVEFFNKKFERGPHWYRTNFKGYNDERLVGETTPGYMMWREDPAEIAARIDRTLSGVKLVSLLRNPVDRTYSAFLHHMRKGRIPTDVELIDRVRNVDPERDPLGLIAGGWYTASLTPYIERFGDRLRIFLYDEIVNDPQRLYSQVLEHIGASTDFLPLDLSRIRHQGNAPVESRYFEEGSRRVLLPAERLEIYKYFRKDIEHLEELLDRDLSIWRPSA